MYFWLKLSKMNSNLEFKDLGFKLAVIDELMYNQEIVTPKIDCREFIAKKRNLTISEACDVIEDEGYEILPEVLDYFKNLEITAQMVQNIEELNVNGGWIYLHIIPFWHGEDDVFNINSAEDCVLLPKLKEITLFYTGDNSLLADFQEKGVEASWV